MIYRLHYFLVLNFLFEGAYYLNCAFQTVITDTSTAECESSEGEVACVRNVSTFSTNVVTGKSD